MGDRSHSSVLGRVTHRDFPRCKVCKSALNLSGRWLSDGFVGVVNLRPPTWECPKGHAVQTIALPPLTAQSDERGAAQ